MRRLGATAEDQDSRVVLEQPLERLPARGPSAQLDEHVRTHGDRAIPLYGRTGHDAGGICRAGIDSGVASDQRRQLLEPLLAW
jgi:hypothetical protein